MSPQELREARNLPVWREARARIAVKQKRTRGSYAQPIRFMAIELQYFDPHKTKPTRLQYYLQKVADPADFPLTGEKLNLLREGPLQMTERQAAEILGVSSPQEVRFREAIARPGLVDIQVEMNLHLYVAKPHPLSLRIVAQEDGWKSDRFTDWLFEDIGKYYGTPHWLNMGGPRADLLSRLRVMVLEWLPMLLNGNVNNRYAMVNGTRSNSKPSLRVLMSRLREADAADMASYERGAMCSPQQAYQDLKALAKWCWQRRVDHVPQAEYVLEKIDREDPFESDLFQEVKERYASRVAG
ncbi:hypothetical protein [Achromobacter xylosoxidans]|uniref:hypothetical protein n=1 Tax=Alcaligenes xylosoxydans xylosoxydans TaxID=85698 RepID=UPI001F1FEE31|nr:hypothetical protein [Achromobacter xylosoxidans]